MADTEKPLLIKRYASRRLYNTETSDYVTLEDIAEFIRDGREVQIIDLKSGDDLTRQYLLQIIAEHESRGESVLPVDVLTDLVKYGHHRDVGLARSSRCTHQQVLVRVICCLVDPALDTVQRFHSGKGGLRPVIELLDWNESLVLADRRGRIYRLHPADDQRCLCRQSE